MNSLDKESKSKIIHPILKENYFKVIDNKEKAYWLGFIYADGYLERLKGNQLRLGIEICKKDEILLDKFIGSIGINKNFKIWFK